MAVERISRATVADLTKGIIQTEEADLLTEGEIISPLVRGNATEQRLVTKFVGEKNYDYFLSQTLKTNEKKSADVSIPERVAYIDDQNDWYRHVLGRELAARSLEMSQLMGVSVLRLVNPMMEMTEGTKYDRLGMLRPFKSGIVQLGQYAKGSVRDDVNMGDLLARERVYREHVLMRETGFLARDLMKSRAVKNSGFGQDKERARRLGRARAAADLDGVIKNDTFFIFDTEPLLETRDTMLPPELREALEVAQAMRTFLWDARSTKDGRALFTNPETWYNFLPSNIELYDAVNKETSENNEPETFESIHIKPISPEEAAEVQARIEARQRELEAQKAEQIKAAEEERRAIDEYNAPIMAELERIKTEYNDVLGEFLNQPKRDLRSIGIIGSNSLSYNLAHVKGQSIDSGDRLARVYDYLRRHASDDVETAKEELSAVLIKLEELYAEYQAYINEHPLKNGAASRIDRLDDGVKAELAWLTAHWNDFKNQLETSAHVSHVAQKQLEDIAQLLGIQPSDMKQTQDMPQVTDDTPEIDFDDDSHSDGREAKAEAPLAQANRLAEQLNWIVLPDERITPGDLVDIAEAATRARSKDGKPAEVELYRMEALLKLREEFGGTLYRSDERTLDDTDNLYFVLRFQHPGDDNFYAVAENPVYGNATYILREDVLPLMPGETVLSAVKLSRRNVRELGAKRIIHGTPDKDIHLEKVNSKLVILSEHESLINA